MNDDAFTIAWLIVVMVLAAISFGISCCSDVAQWKRIRRVAVTVFFTAWLTVPWTCLLLNKVWHWNMNMVNQMSRPDTITPVPGRTYRADEIRSLK